MCVDSISGEQEGEGDLARPCRGQDFLDDTEAFIGVDETVRSGQDPDVLGDGARCHPEQDQSAGAGISRADFRHHLARAVSQNLAGSGFTPIPAVGRDQKWFIPNNFAPDAARQPETITADAAQAGLIMVRRAEPSVALPLKAR